MSNHHNGQRRLVRRELQPHLIQLGRQRIAHTQHNILINARLQLQRLCQLLQRMSLKQKAPERIVLMRQHFPVVFRHRVKDSPEIRGRLYFGRNPRIARLIDHRHFRRPRRRNLVLIVHGIVRIFVVAGDETSRDFGDCGAVSVRRSAWECRRRCGIIVVVVVVIVALARVM